MTPLLMCTDPPYGVEYDPSWRNQAGAAKTRRTGKVLNDDRADWRETWSLFPGDVAYVWLLPCFFVHRASVSFWERLAGLSSQPCGVAGFTFQVHQSGFERMPLQVF